MSPRMNYFANGISPTLRNLIDMCTCDGRVFHSAEDGRVHGRRSHHINVMT
jgi:hypothetical protein